MSYRPKLVFCGPVSTMSGYGSHARDLVSSLIEMDKFDIKIISLNWGETPMNALNSENKTDKEILDRILPNNQLDSQPDVWMHCTIPNEFQTVGKYNIGITAGIETDACSPEWIDGCNKMDLVIVPSKHAKFVFENTKYDKRDKITNQTVGILEIKTKVEVLHEGIKTEIYKKTEELDLEIKETIDSISEKFLFLFVGHWLRGDFMQDRKDVSGLIYTFLETFGDRPNQPALLLKSSCGTFSITDRSNLIKKIEMIKKMSKKQNLPKIYLLHGELTDEQMNSLYNHPKVKSLVSFTKGEGYGRPILEFMASGKPVAVSGWSGQTDFVSEKSHTLLKGEITEVHSSAVWEGVINKGTHWFTVNYQEAAKVLDKIHTNYTKYLNSSKISVREVEKIWSYDSMKNKFDKLMDDYLPKFAEKVEMHLPKLKKISPNNPDK